MPRTVTKPANQMTTQTVSRLKLYAYDHEQAVKLQELAQPLFRHLTLQEIIREAVSEGLPTIVSKYTAAVEAAKKADRS